MTNSRSIDRSEATLPTWFKLTISGLVFSHWYIFLHVLALAGETDPFNSPQAILYYALLIFILSGILLVFLIWIEPTNNLLVAGYLYLRKFRWLTTVLGIVLVALLIWNGKTITSLSRLLIYLNAIALSLSGIILKPVDSESIPPFPRFPKWITAVLMAALPATICLLILSFGFGVEFSHYRPRMWNDQIGYWHWARSFSYYGFGGGYNGWDELTARAAFNPFGENGPFYPAIYGSIGRLVGWTSSLPLMINMGIIAVSIFTFIYVAQLDRKQMLMTGIATILLWPVLLYMPTSMHESLNQAIAILMASIFFVLLLQKENTPPYQKIIFLAFTIFAAFIRLSWGLLFLPLFFLILAGKFPQRLIAASVLSAFLGVAIMQLYGLLVPPTGNIIYTLIESSISSGPGVFIRHITNELQHLIYSPKNRIDLIIVIQLLTLAIWSVLGIIRSKGKMEWRKSQQAQSTIYFNIYNLLMPLLMALIFYLVNGFNRILVTHILLSVLLLIAQKNYRPIAAILLIGVIAGQPYLSEFKQLKENFLPDSNEFIDSRNLIEEFVIFDEETDNRWCNTLLLPINEYNYHVSMIPPGIGISPIIYPESIEFPLKSKYLLLDQSTFNLFSDNINTELLVSLAHVNLYYNFDSACPRE